MEKNEKLAAGLAIAKAICRKKELEKVAIGIDLGTSTCTVGVYNNGRVEMILNEGDSDIGPVFFPASEEDSKMLQELAESQKVQSCPRTTVCDMMKMVGRGYYDRSEPYDMKMLPFKVTSVAGHPALEVMCRRTDRRFTPVEISSKILEKVREIAECLLGKAVNIAVVTVPVYFNEHEATKDAATNAGFRVLRLMPEPVAAAVAYGFPQLDGRKYVLMFDLGGGTLDVSVFLVTNGVFDLKSASGNTQLGGKDFDRSIINYVANEIESEHGIEVTTNKLTMEKLQVLCEQAKRCLSKYDAAVVRLDVDGKSYKSTISRTKFEEMNAELFSSTLEAVEDALDDANIPKECVDQIVLVGGSTKIPKIQSLLREFFDGKELIQASKPEEAVAFGAAIEAAMVAKEETEKMNDVVYDTVPLSIGIKTAGGAMAVFVPRNTELPCTFTNYLSTYVDNQPSAIIQVYEGEQKMAKNNSHLADLELKMPVPARRGDPKIEVTFCVDKSGIIIVNARELTTGAKTSTMITSNYDKLAKTGPIKMVLDCDSDEQAEGERACFCDEGDEEESPCGTDALQNCKMVVGKVNELLKWLENNPSPPNGDIECHHEGMERCCADAVSQLIRSCTPIVAETPAVVDCRVAEPPAIVGCRVAEPPAVVGCTVAGFPSMSPIHCASAKKL